MEAFCACLPKAQQRQDAFSRHQTGLDKRLICYTGQLKPFRILFFTIPTIFSLFLLLEELL